MCSCSELSIFLKESLVEITGSLILTWRNLSLLCHQCPVWGERMFVMSFSGSHIAHASVESFSQVSTAIFSVLGAETSSCISDT